MTAYCKPFKRGVSWRSQNFGDNPNNGTNGAGGHTGNDDAAPIGSEVHAAGDGIIEYAGQFDDTYADNLLWLIDFGGNILVLNCGDSEPTFVYAHLSQFLVKPGDRVRKGQVIAFSGNSGTRTTGPHCHNEAIAPGYVLNSPTLGRVNPDTYLTEWPDDIGGIAAMGETITPLSQEDEMALPADFENEWNTIKEQIASLVTNVATKKDVPTAKENEFVQAALVSLVNNVATKADLSGVSAAVVSAAKSGASKDEIRAAVDAAMAAGLKVDVTVNGGK